MTRRMISAELVGRTDAIEQLRDVLASARQGHIRHVLVNGEAGVGKSRLLTSAADIAREEGFRVLLGGCVSMGDAGLPFAPYAEIVRALIVEDGAAQTAALAGRAASDLSRLVPSLASDDEAPTQELLAQSRLYESLFEFLRRLAGRTPLMLQLEDLHWADPGTLAATAFLFRAIREEPIVIVGTIRSDEVTRRHPLRPWLAEVGRSERVEQLDLEPLSAAESAQLVRNITGVEHTLGELEDIHRRSDGNPFFVEELLASGVDQDRFLPTLLRDVLLARVDALAPSAQQLLSVAAVGGREVEHEVLLGVAGRSESESLHDLGALVEANLLVPVSTPQREGYAFRHALLQEAVHDVVLPSEQRRLHQLYAEQLQLRGAGTSGDVSQLVQLAHHWRQARDVRALEASIRAGDAAMESYAFSTAAVEYDHALALWGDRVGAAEGEIDHVELLARACRAANYSGDPRSAVKLAREAMDELGEDADAARRTELGILLGRVLWIAGDWTASLEAYESALASAPPAPHLARIHALAGLGQGYMLFGWLSRSRPLCEEAVRLARTVGARALEGHGLNTLSVDLAGMGESEAAIQAIDEALAIARELDIPDDIGRAHVNRGDVLNWVGYPDQALESTRRGIDEVIGLGMETSYGTFLRTNGVTFAYLIGAWQEAAELLAAADRSGDSSVGTQAYRAEYALPFLVSSGHPEAPSVWAKTRQMRSEHPGSATSMPTFQAAMEMACYEDRFEEAVEFAEEGFELLEHIEGFNRIDDMARAIAWPLAEIGRQARLESDEERFQKARSRLDEIIAAMQESRAKLGSPGGRLGEVLSTQEAHVAMERLRLLGDDTVAGWGAVAGRWRELGLPFIEAYALWRGAGAADAADQHDDAVESLRAAHVIASRLGARPMLEQLGTMARALHVRLGTTASSSPEDGGSAFGLTPRELEVLTLLAEGRTNRQIAETLYISGSTAGVHVSNILSKLGVSTRTEAASVALAQGLVGA